ncbi:MAG: Hin recombinase [Acetobacteraceae bacterium]|nr:Hin recombinase [Acetobacteraceae bacterium]
MKMGRKPKLTAHQQRGARQGVESGETVRDVTRSYNVHNSTIFAASIAQLTGNLGRLASLRGACYRSF